jgi:hypothetical protein
MKSLVLFCRESCFMCFDIVLPHYIFTLICCNKNKATDLLSDVLCVTQWKSTLVIWAPNSLNQHVCSLINWKPGVLHSIGICSVCWESNKRKTFPKLLICNLLQYFNDGLNHFSELHLSFEAYCTFRFIFCLSKCQIGNTVEPQLTNLICSWRPYVTRNVRKPKLFFP